MPFFAYDAAAVNGVILANGRVIDPFGTYPEDSAIVVLGEHLHAICAFQEATRAFPAAKVTDLEERYVSAGFIDMHAHVGGGIGLLPDEIGVRAGVTTLLDCGSTGADTLASLRETIRRSETEIFVLLHIARGGIPRNLKEAVDLAGLDVEAAVRTAKAFPGLVRGIKVRIDTPIIGDNSLVPAIRAKKAACRAELPLMIHIANEPPQLQDTLELLDAGDIVAHCFNGRTARIVDRQGNVRPCALAARERGVFFDVGHGGGSFSIDSARKAVGAGFMPDTISSDLHLLSQDKNLFSLAVTMSKFLTLGLDLHASIRLVTASPALILGLDASHGRLMPGRKADLTVFSIQWGEYAFRDSQGEIFMGERLIVPEFVLKAGKPFICDKVSGFPGQREDNQTRSAS